MLTHHITSTAGNGALLLHHVLIVLVHKCTECVHAEKCVKIQSRLRFTKVQKWTDTPHIARHLRLSPRDLFVDLKLNVATSSFEPLPQPSRAYPGSTRRSDWLRGSPTLWLRGWRFRVADLSSTTGEGHANTSTSSWASESARQQVTLPLRGRLGLF